jgi:hypothetical protein
VICVMIRKCEPMNRKRRIILIGRSCRVERGAVPQRDSLCKGRRNAEGARSERMVWGLGLSQPICVRIGELSIFLARRIRASVLH